MTLQIPSEKRLRQKIELVNQWLIELATKIKLVQMNRHKAQMNVEKLIKESKFTAEGQVSKLMRKQQEVDEYTGPGRPIPTRPQTPV